MAAKVQDTKHKPRALTLDPLHDACVQRLGLDIVGMLSQIFSRSFSLSKPSHQAVQLRLDHQHRLTVLVLGHQEVLDQTRPEAVFLVQRLSENTGISEGVSFGNFPVTRKAD